MARGDPTLDSALTRWREKGLISAAQAEVLRAEALAEHERRSRGRGRLWVSAVGAAAAFGAAVLFATATWPELAETGRTLLLAAGAVMAYGVGLGVQRRPRWAVAGELLRITGAALGLAAVVYSPNGWPLESAGSRLWGVVGLGAAVGAGWMAGLAPVRTAVGHVVFVLPYLAAFLVLTAGLEFEPVIWTLDGVWAAGLVVVGLRASGAKAGRRSALLPVLITGAWIGFALLFLTGATVLELEDRTVWPMDVWMATMALLTGWAASRAPTEAEAEFLERHLAACIPVATALAVFSVAETLEWPGEAWLAAGVMVASAGMTWAHRVRNGLGLGSAAASLIAVIWIYTVERGDAAFGAVALFLTAALFFWVGSRIRDR
jgi:hypothetical protein